MKNEGLIAECYVVIVLSTDTISQCEAISTTSREVSIEMKGEKKRECDRQKGQAPKVIRL